MLLEIIVSIALFGVVTTAMVSALHQLSKTSKTARDEVSTQRRFESIFAELASGSNPQLTSGKRLIPADGTGIAVMLNVVPEELLSNEGAPLGSVFRVTMTAGIEGDSSFERTAERLIYAPPKGRTSNR
ncbi:MAG: hypothetical protein P1U85_15775 [Verrucomicrobiales bacterium]|nr:hypothetical protein [Verrucomicrobiales bacterium]